jgi:hypothetical protein
MKGIIEKRRLDRLAQITNSEDEFLKESIRFWHWYMTPEMRMWTRDHLRRFYGQFRQQHVLGIVRKLPSKSSD